MKKLTIVIFFLSFNGIIGFGQNLILNGDFENNGQLFCDSWYDHCGQELTYLCETNPPEPVCDVSFYEDAPPADGIWSIGVTGVGNSFPSSASAYVTGLDGTNDYQLNVWMKDAGNAFGGTEVGVLSEGQYTAVKMISADSGDWKFYTASFELKMDPSDSIQVRLWAFAAGPLFGVINFDLVELIRLDTVNSILHEDEDEIVHLLPNPANDIIYFDSDWQEAIVFDLNGMERIHVDNNSAQPYINVSGLPGGNYFVEVVFKDGRRKMAKFVKE